MTLDEQIIFLAFFHWLHWLKRWEFSSIFLVPICPQSRFTESKDMKYCSKFSVVKRLWVAADSIWKLFRIAFMWCFLLHYTNSWGVILCKWTGRAFLMSMRLTLNWRASIDSFHMTSRRPCWCTKTKERRLTLWELNSNQILSFVSLNQYSRWSREWKRSIGSPMACGKVSNLESVRNQWSNSPLLLCLIYCFDLRVFVSTFQRSLLT